VLNCIRVAKEGGTIAIAPEGNRTYSGKTEYMGKTIASLARKLGLPIAFVRLEGGYGTHPRWSDVVRKGKTFCRVSRIMEPSEYAELSDEALAETIRSELYVNEAVADGRFRHKKRAEYLERAMYVCPDCGLSTFESDKNIIECKKCNKKIEYLATKELKGVNCDFPHRFLLDWYKAQEDLINSLDLTLYYDKPMYQDLAQVKEVIPSVKKIPLYPRATVTLFGNRVVLEYKEDKN
jgi:DNA-directed RNA polymerase subunit RPC12/RpoP